MPVARSAPGLVFLLVSTALAQNASVLVTVDANGNRHPINPNVYGVAYGDATTLADLNCPLNRQGGNNTTRYNWQVNGDNRGNDWYFESIGDSSGVAGERGDSFLAMSKSAGAQPMLTMPMIGWVARLGPNRGKLASFSIQKYGAQTGSDWQWFSDAGNGVLQASGQNITGNDPNDANVLTDSSYQQQWAQHLVSRWGTVPNGGLRYYILDNEPSIWHSTHRDVHPTGATMAEIRDKILDYAAKIRAVDPNATIVGPEEWGWSGYLLSGYDQQYGSLHGWSVMPDRNNNGGADYLPWLLSQLKQATTSSGVKYLDVFSVHYYPQGGEFGGDTSAAMQLRRNRSTRSLWDPNYVDESWINDKVQLIPRLKSWVNANYFSGTPVAITEYNWGAESYIGGATAQADIFGIFGREGLDMAARWTTPDPSTPTYKAMKMYRNYDGNKSGFGDVSLLASAPNPDNVAAFAAQRSTDGALTVMVINKYLSGNTPVTLNLSNFPAAGTAQVWQLTSANAITRQPDVSINANAVSATLPALSVTLFVVPASASASSTPHAVISATPSTGATPLAVSFSGTGSTDQGGTITSYSWDFGDGSSASGTIASHTYHAAGTYQGRLTVIDNLGASASITKTIAVSAPAAASQAPTIGSCSVLPADNIWNAPIDQLPVSSNSATYVNTIGPTKPVHADFGSGTFGGGPIGIPFVTVPGTQTKYPATFQYADESDPGPYAVPLNAPIEGGSQSSGDRHALAIDTDNCVLYELYSAFPQAASWQAGSGAIYDLRSNALRPIPWTSADAAGLPIFPGLARYDEIVAGEIRHALRFTVPQTQKAFVWPARHQASSLTGLQYPPMGVRFRLKANFDISSYSATNQIILRALKKYGMIIADNGSAWFLSGAPDSRWDNSDLHNLGLLTGANFEAVDVSSMMVDPNSGQVRPSVSGVPTADSITPSSGSGTTQTFALQYSDSAGATNLQSVWVWFTTGTAANTCLAYYDRPANKVNLYNDAGTAVAGAAPGAATTLQNSRCSINVAATTVTLSGNTLTLTLPLTFKPAFGGAKNVYMYSGDVSGPNTGWQQRGTWTVPNSTAVTADSSSPNTGSGTAQSFTLQYSDSAGATSFQSVWVWFTTGAASNSCLAYYDRTANKVNLYNDAGTTFAGSTPGAATTLQNSQCSINVAATTVGVSGNTLTLTLPLTFKPAFGGAKNIYMYSGDVSGPNSGWQQRGSWNVPNSIVVTADSSSPNTGSGSTQSFALQYSDSAGAASLQSVWVWFTTGAAANSCLAYYDRAASKVNLYNDAASTWAGATPGSATTLQNSQCSINVAATTVLLSGNTLTLTLPMTFKPAFSGAKNIFMYGGDVSGLSSGWQQRGMWTVP